MGEFLPNGPNGGNIPKSNMLVGYFLPYGKNNPIGFFFSHGIFHGTADRSENPTGIPGGFMF
jgi:hypothetical protein